MYLALYRKYRPRTFDDVISQEPITTTLKNQIKSGSAGHAYLFTGSRGTGKTTCAKILAMAVNCLNPKDGNPCLECDRCKEILDGSATDIVEMDAASNNGVDDVRQLRDEVNYTPVSCKYRVYIIDEVHMLSPAAFNALLKTLEEPPPHVKFILATTELQKVPATIVSRCQRFEFRRIDPAESAKRLFFAANEEGIILDSDAAELISRLSDGGMRDALSILDRCASADKHVTSEIVRRCAGVAETSHLTAFTKMIAEQDAAGCIRLLSELYSRSKDPALIIDDLSERFRDIMIYKTAPSDVDLLTALPSDIGDIKAAAEAYSLGDILRCMNLMRQCADNIGKTRGRKILAEMCFVKMCLGLGADAGAPARTVSIKPEMRVKELPKEEFVPTPPEKMSRESLNNLSRMRALGEETAKLVESEESAPIPEPPAPPVPDVIEEKAAEPIEERNEIPESDNPASDEKKASVPDKITQEEWQSVIAKCDIMTATMLGGSKAEIENGTLVIRSSNNMLVNNVKNEELDAFRAEIAKALGLEIAVKIEKEALSDAETADNQSEIDKLLNKARQLGIEIKQE
ncbi:MAG TPA: DNA polymerase III subunit gamma/tau [Ruminococcaceae bacterium]|nr:DNA polymerase III subunit gamma/tau [Oscillospiraceae bacterium]